MSQILLGFKKYIKKFPQNIIEDKLDRKQWPFLSDPAPIATTQTVVRYEQHVDYTRFISHTGLPLSFTIFDFLCLFFQNRKCFWSDLALSCFEATFGSVFSGSLCLHIPRESHFYFLFLQKMVAYFVQKGTAVLYCTLTGPILRYTHRIQKVFLFLKLFFTWILMIITLSGGRNLT